MEENNNNNNNTVRKVYPYDEVYKSTLEYFNGDELATTVWIKKYCYKFLHDDGTIDYYERTPEDMFRRLAKEYARAGEKYNNPLTEDEIFELFNHYKYIFPQGRPLAGIGTGDAVSISNCFVVGYPEYDSYGTILLEDEEMTHIFRRGGGSGVDISHYRPKNSKVHNAAMTSSGPVEICAKRFSNTVREVGQCIEEHQHVLTSNCLKEIKDVEVGDKVWTEKGFIEVINKYDNGVKSVYKVNTDSDMHILATDNHTFLYSEDGEHFVERQLGDFKEGDNIAMLIGNMKVPVRFHNLEYVGEKQVYDIELADEHLFWCEGFYVHNSSRRGALMISMDVTHPDAEEFIDAKTNSTEITGANISVKIYDDWLKSFIDNPNPNKENERLWDKIIHNAWQWAEPGVLFWDTIIRESVPDCYEKYGFKTLSTNPCQPGFAPVLSETEGIIPIDEVKVGMSLWTETGWATVIGKRNAGNKDVYAYMTSAGVVYATSDHNIISKGEKKMISEAEVIDALNGPITDFEVKEDIPLILDGLLIAEGNVQEKTPSHLVLLDVTNKDDSILEGELSKYFGKRHWENDEYGYEIKGYTLSKDEIKKRVGDKIIPERYLRMDRSSICNFLKGLYSGMSNYDKDKNRLRIKRVNYEFGVRLMFLLYRIGVSSRIQKDDMGYMVRIDKDVNRFMKYVGFLQPEKQNEVKEDKSAYVNKTTLEPGKVYESKFMGTYDVYDITMDNETHTYWSGGLNVCNCGEIPLSAKDSCRLMGVNLYSYVVNPFTKDAYFDFDLFKKHSRLIMKLMDNMIDLELEKIDLIIDKISSDPEPEYIKGRELQLWKDIKEIAIKGRRSGIGFTGEGDMLAALGYKYGTKEATDFSIKVQKTLAENVYIESCLLVQEEGREKFPVFDYELEKNNPFLNRLAEGCEEFDKLWRNGKGRRNIATLTCAPVGSLSTQTQTTSGIEPLFMPFYFRKRKLEKIEGIKPDFIDDNGDWFEEYFVCHDKYIVWYSVYKGISFQEAKKELTSLKKNEMEEIYKHSPYYGATSNDVDWTEKVRMQGGIQKYIDHSVSACVVADTLIETEDGLYYLDELTNFATLKKGEFRYNDSFESKVPTMGGELHKISRFYNNGLKDTFLVKLENGTYIECTSNESFYVWNKKNGTYQWKEVSELNEGDSVRVNF